MTSPRTRFGRFIDEGEYIQVLSPCGNCIHKTKGKPTCAAFPNGIPAQILSGENQHDKPFKGDNGIQFEEIR